MQDVLGNLRSLSATATSIVGTLRTAEKEVQTDFPSTLIEEYVVNNRKRILKLLGFTATASNPAAGSSKRPAVSSLGASAELQLDRPQTLRLHSSWNPLPKAAGTATPPNSLKVEDEMNNQQHRPPRPTKKIQQQHPKRNLYVAGHTTHHSMDCPTISVEKCSDGESPPRPSKYTGAKRHSSTGDALELYRGNLEIQKRLRDLEANHSSSSLEAPPNTDF